MVFKNKKRVIRQQYTLVELLVVLVIAGLLMGLTVGGIRGALARQGAAGAVRTLSTKISLAQSFAVSRNRYVALLLPDHEPANGDLDGSTASNDPIPVDNTKNFEDAFLFTQNRLCFVEKDSSGNYVFDRWVEGYEWQKLPAKTIAFIVSEAAGTEKSNSAKVTTVDGTANKDSSAIIFKPSGAMVDASPVIIRVYRAAYVPAELKTNFFWQGTEDPTKGWKVVINGFTGRTQFCMGGESVED